MKRISTLLRVLPFLTAASLSAQTHRITPELPAVLLPIPTLPSNSQSLLLSSTADLKANTYDPTLATRLQSAIDKSLSSVSANVRHGVIASVVAPGLGQWTGASGFSGASEPATTDMRFQIASISKTFTAAIIFQLEEEGKLSLDDSISRWLPSHPNIDSTTTVRQLLGHTSGIYDYMNDDTNGAVIFYTYLVDPGKTWTPEEVLASYVGTPNFKPGKGVQYSNTNYLLLGLIIEKVTGNSVADEIHSRLLSKFDLQNTYVGWSDTVKGEMMHGWSIGFDSQDPTNQADISSIPSTAILSAAWTAGGLVSTAGDLAQWANALYSGQVINRTSLDKMLTFRTGSDGLAYGLGAFRFPYYSQPLYGHTGGLLGYSSWIFSAPDDSLSVSILVNSYTQADNGMNNIAIAVLNELYRASGTNSVPLESGALAGVIAPNTVAEHATVSYSVPARSRVVVEITDALGRHIKTITDEVQDMGRYSMPVDMSESASGAYFCVMHVGNITQTLPVQVVR